MKHLQFLSEQCNTHMPIMWEKPLDEDGRGGPHGREHKNIITLAPIPKPKE
jgi:hypothetical protein